MFKSLRSIGPADPDGAAYEEDCRHKITKLAELKELLEGDMIRLLPGLESTAMQHHSQSVDNISVSNVGNVTRILDWENISLAPLWELYQVPPMLDDDGELEYEPELESYALEE